MFDFGSEFLSRFVMTYPVFLFSLTIHEVAHAITAKWGGDLTAAYQGRTSLSPTTHIDPIGTVLMPIIGASTGVPILGWARPVPVVETNFQRGSDYGMVVVMAGPFSNLILAAFTVPVMMLAAIFYPQLVAQFGESAFEVIWSVLHYMVLINVWLFFFNLLPIPPLDGSHMLWHLVIKSRPRLYEFYDLLWRAGFFILILFLLTGAFGLYFNAVYTPFRAVLRFLLSLVA